MSGLYSRCFLVSCSSLSVAVVHWFWSMSVTGTVFDRCRDRVGIRSVRWYVYCWCIVGISGGLVTVHQ